MSYPDLYDITYSYSTFQLGQGNNTFPGTQIDADLDGLETSVSNISTFMKTVIRSDGALNNGIVTFDSLSPNLEAAAAALGNPAVLGPGVAVDTTPAVFDGVSGRLVKNITFAAFKALLALVKGDVGLGNVDNTSDATKNAAAVALTNKTIVGSSNTISNLTTAMFAANVVDNDGTLAANSSTRLPTQAAVKAYSDQIIAAADAMVFK